MYRLRESLIGQSDAKDDHKDAFGAQMAKIYSLKKIKYILTLIDYLAVMVLPGTCNTGLCRKCCS